MGWCFAIVNNRLAEIYFNEGKNGRHGKITNHCYVKREEFKTKKEQKWIDEDTKRVKVVYRNKLYKLLKPSK